MTIQNLDGEFVVKMKHPVCKSQIPDFKDEEESCVSM